MYIDVELSEKNLIYILNCLNLCLRCLEYHYEIDDIRNETKRYFNIENYATDYENIRTLHRILSSKGNKDIYNITDDVFFRGQADYLCSKEKDFKILQNKKNIKILKKVITSKVMRKNYQFIKFLILRIINIIISLIDISIINKSVEEVFWSIKHHILSHL